MASSQRSSGCLPILILGALVWVMAVQPVLNRNDEAREAEQIDVALAALPATITMPDLTGRSVAAANGVLSAEFDGAINDVDDLDLPEGFDAYSELGDRWEAAGGSFENAGSADLSPKGRDPEDGWVVQVTRPGPGEPVDRRTVVWLFALSESEAAWYDANPTMPGIPAGVTPDSLMSPGGLLEPVAALVDLRYADEPAIPERPSWRSLRGVVPPNPAMEPDPEWQARTSFRSASNTFSSLVAGQLPSPGAPLRRGQLPVVAVVDPPPPPPVQSSGSAGGSWDADVYIDGDDDDDFNVPGWLCPTRFC